MKSHHWIYLWKQKADQKGWVGNKKVETISVNYFIQAIFQERNKIKLGSAHQEKNKTKLVIGLCRQMM